MEKPPHLNALRFHAYCVQKGKVNLFFYKDFTPMALETAFFLNLNLLPKTELPKCLADNGKHLSGLCRKKSNMNLLEQIRELYEFAFNNSTQELKMIDIGTVFAEEIKVATGHEVEGFVVSVDNFAVLHIAKRHDQENETRENQIPVELEDLQKLESIVFEADTIQNGGNRRGKLSVYIKKSP